MNAIYHWVGFGTVWLMLLILAICVAYQFYKTIRAMILGADFVRWYLAQSKNYDPEYKMKVSLFNAWIQACADMIDYNESTTMTHNNGAVYKPFAKVY